MKTLITKNGAAPDTWKLINPDDIKAIQQSSVNCKQLGEDAFNEFTEKAMQEVNWPCLREVLDKLKVDKLANLGEDTCKDEEGMEKIVAKAEHDKGIIALLSTPCVKAIFEHGTEGVWKTINADNFMNGTEQQRREKLGFFTHSAVAEMKLETKGLVTDVLNKMKADVFASITSDIAEATFKNMTAEMVEKFGSLRTDYGKCGNFKPTKLNPDRLSKVDPSCFASYLRNHAASSLKSSVIGENFYKLGKDAFSKIEEASEFTKFSSGDFDGMSKDQLASMVQNFPEACQHVNTGVNKKFFEKFFPTAKCFSDLPAPLQANMLGNFLTKLPEDVLAYLTNEKVGKIAKDGKTGIAFFDSIKLPVKYLVHLGSHVEAHEHPCLSVGLKDFTAMKHFPNNIGPHCYQALTFMSELGSEKEKIKFPDTVYALSPVSEILIKAPAFFKTLTSTTLRLAASGDHFCVSIDQPVISTIPAPAFAGMTFDCLVKMKTNAKFISVPQLNFVPADSFVMIDAEIGKNFVPLTNLTAPQLKKLSTGIKDATKSAFILVTATEMAKFTVQQLASFDANQLAAILADAFTGLETIEQIKAILATAWTKVVFEQVKSIKEQLLIALPADSIRNLSKDVADKTKKAGRIYTPELIELLPAESVAAAKEVSGNGASTARASVAAIAIAAVVTLLFC